MKKSAKNKDLPKYIWEKPRLNYFVCLGQAEVSRPGIKKAWVAMVPHAIDERGGKSWYLLREGETIREFRSAKEAMEAVELYLGIFNQYHQHHFSESFDMSAGEMGISGAHS